MLFLYELGILLVGKRGPVDDLIVFLISTSAERRGSSTNRSHNVRTPSQYPESSRCGMW